jgi:hypothetical protein
MKNVFDVLRTKEQDIQRVRKEVDALRVAARLLAEDGETQILEMPEGNAKRAAAGDQPNA